MRTSRVATSPAGRRRGDAVALAAGLLAAVVAVGILGMHALTPPDPGTAHHGVATVTHATGGEHAPDSPVAVDSVDSVDQGNGSGHLLMICGVMLAAAGGLLLRQSRAGTSRGAGQRRRATALRRPPLRTQVSIARPPPVLAFSVIRC